MISIRIERNGVIPTPPAINTNLSLKFLMTKSPIGPEVSTSSPGFRLKSALLKELPFSKSNFDVSIIFFSNGAVDMEKGLEFPRSSGLS